MISFSLRTKFILGIAVLILMVGMTILLFLRAELRSYLDHELHKRGISIARNLSRDVTAPILTENRFKLQFLVDDYKKNEEDLRYIYIVTNQNEVLAHTFEKGFPKDLLGTADSAISGDDRGQIRLITSDDELVKDISVPIRNGMIGRVHVGIPESVISKNLRAMALHLLPYVATILFLGTLTALLFAASISRPIKALALGANMVGTGRLDWKIIVDSHDEIGELAVTFNSMTEELQRKTLERQRIEEELHLQAVTLEAEVARRQTTQEELALKQHQLEALNQSLEDRISRTLAEIRHKDQLLIQQGRFVAMGEMISNIAHQWRQPLNNVGLIIQNLQLLFDTGDLTAEEMNDEVDAAMKIIYFMSQTIDDFRNFFCKDKDKSDFSISRAVAKAIDFISPALKNKKIAIEFEDEFDSESFGHGYANEFTQVLLNVIGNAKDVLLERMVAQPCIHIRLFRTNDRPVVTIWDNGGGIDESILPKIFDPYFTTKGMTQGTGIGLYMSKIIIEHHMGGRLSAGNVSEGTEFRIEL